MTVSSFHYDESRRELLEYEMYFKIDRKARDVEDIVRIRSELEKKGCRHFRNWLLRHLKVHLERKVDAGFEWEYRAERQVEQFRASVRRFVLFRVDRQWQPMSLLPGTMRFAKRRMKRRRKHVKKRGRKYGEK
jgi:hypothetical protein